MPSFADLIARSSAHAWLFVPSAVLLGALHGLEPGHSKTMMAAFIVAIRGTVLQAIILGLAATVSQTAVVGAVAVGGMYIWQGIDAKSIEPYFQLVSAAVIIGTAAWMIRRTWLDQQRAKAAAGEHHYRHQFADRKVTNWQIALFGLTGGLIPCPAAITVLLLCLQLKEVTLGFALVLCFSIGLAITLLASGAVATVSFNEVTSRFPWFGTLARRAPYVSSMPIMAVGIYVGVQGWADLSHHAAAAPITTRVTNG